MRNQTLIRLNFEKYKDRVYACWLGKNIGGTMGAPYEGQRRTWDIKGFATEAGKPMPNDDLDLQLIWLHAVEQMGPHAINAAMLGEFWISLIPPNWNEYGIGKNNVKRGLIPPVSGDYQNSWKNSNGAWIRTEIWACLAPGCPEIAAKYAIEDASVDHGAGEGTIAAAFVAAMQASAFVVGDVRKCIELALTAIPADSRMADSISFTLDCYDRGIDPITAAKEIQKRNSDIGDGWFEAPSNVAYAVIGLLWGEGDFKKSMITAINCGDDTDCTGATVGATLGILGGPHAIPEDWKRHVGDDIVTVSINRGDFYTGASVPKTCSELTERVVAQAPFVLYANHTAVELCDKESMINQGSVDYVRDQCASLQRNVKFVPYSARFYSPVLSAEVILDSSPDIAPNESKNVSVTVSCNRMLGDELCNIQCRWWLPEGFEVSGKTTAIITNKNAHDSGLAELHFEIKAGDGVRADNRCVLEIMPIGRGIPLYASILLLG